MIHVLLQIPITSRLISFVKRKCFHPSLTHLGASLALAQAPLGHSTLCRMPSME